MGAKQEAAYVDVFSEETGIATFTLPLDSEWSDWFRSRCSDVLKPISLSNEVQECKVYDGNWIHVGQRFGSEWLVGESHGPAPDSELYELQEAALALVAAVTSPPDIRAAHLVRLHTIISSTERYLLPGTPRGVACEGMTPDDVAKNNARMNRELQEKCGDKVLREETPSFSRACEGIAAKNADASFD